MNYDALDRGGLELSALRAFEVTMVAFDGSRCDCSSGEEVAEVALPPNGIVRGESLHQPVNHP